MADEKKLNREAWLNRLAEMLRPWFREAGYPIHGRISVGMALLRPNTLGLCKSTNKTKDMCHVFVSAYEDGVMADPVNIGATLVHELLHAVLPTRGHGKAFKAGMKKLKLGGLATATVAMPELRAHLERLIATLPPLPRYGVKAPPAPASRGGGNRRMFKFQCECCKTTVYLKYTSLDRAGMPMCWNVECEMEGEEMAEQDMPDK